MKIWLLTTEYPPFHGGGISTYGGQTARMLQQEGATLTVFLCDKNIDRTLVSNEAGVRVVRFSPYGFAEKDFLGYETLVSFAFARTLQSYIQKEGQPDIIESQEYNGIAYFTLLFKKLLYKEFKAVPVIITIHAPAFVCQPYNQESSFKLPYFWIHEMEKFCLQAADHVIAPSHYIIDQIRSGFPEFSNEYTVIRNPYYITSSALPAGPVNKKEFVFYGKTSPLKGIFELLRCFKTLWQKDEALTLRLVGGTDHYYHAGGMLMGDIIKKEYAAPIAAGQLILEGKIHPSQLPEKMATAGAVIFPSRVDNFPYAVIECMAMGKVVLASTSGGHREIIHDKENGFLFSLQEPASFYEKMDLLLNLDEHNARQMGQAALSTVSSVCDPAAIGNLKMQLFRELVTADTHHFPFLRQGPQTRKPPVAEEQPGLLSVVVPYFNMGKYVGDTLDSLLRSGYKNMEIILVNDGSDDMHSIKVLELYRSMERVRVLDTSNQGLPKARNHGAAHAKGEFLAFLDPDDTVEPDYYPMAIDLLKHYDNVWFAGAWTRYFEEGSGAWPGFIPEPPFLLVHNMANTSSLVYKKAAFLDKGLNDPAMIFGMEDYDSLIGMVSHGYNGVVIPELLFNYRVRKNSMARQFTIEKIAYLHELISQKHRNYYSIFASEINNLLNINGPGYKYDNPTLDYHIRTNRLAKMVSPKLLQRVKQNKYLRKHLITLNQFIKNKKL